MTPSSPGSGNPAPSVAAKSAPRGPVRQVLPNGLRLIVQDHRAADIVAVYLYVGIGVRYERPDELGYLHFQEHTLFKRTDKWGLGYIDRAFEGVGVRTNATTSFDYTDFCIVPVEAMEMAIQTRSQRWRFAPRSRRPRSIMSAR
jgi:predicted Zn-dependent peptidase